MDGSGNQAGGELQRIDGGRGGWRLPALLVAAALIGVVVIARLGMEPDPPTGLGPTLRPAATLAPEPTPQEPAISPEPSVPGPAGGEPVRVGPGLSQVWIGRYADGIPLRFDDLPVRRVDEVVARQPSGTVFVGGWYVGPSCGRLGQVGYCPYGRMADSPADVMNALRSIRLAGAVPVDRAGPAVFRATVELACLPECEVTMSVQEALWLGDQLTDTGPIGVLPLLSSLSYAFPGLTAAAVEERPDCPILPPAQAYRLTGAGVRAALIYPTPADREAAEGPVRVGRRVMLVEERGQCRVPPLPRDDATWVAQDNVLLLVATARPLTAELASAALDDARAQSRNDGPAEAAPISAWQALSTLWRAYPGLVLVPGAEEAFEGEQLPPTTLLLRGADVRVLAVFPDRRTRRALDAKTLPRLVAVRGELDLRLRWVGIENLLLGVSGGPEAAERVRELVREGRH